MSENPAVMDDGRRRYEQLQKKSRLKKIKVIERLIGATVLIYQHTLDEENKIFRSCYPIELDGRNICKKNERQSQNYHGRGNGNQKFSRLGYDA